jgi:hypothetical protein
VETEVGRRAGRTGQHAHPDRLVEGSPVVLAEREQAAGVHRAVPGRLADRLQRQGHRGEQVGSTQPSGDTGCLVDQLPGLVEPAPVVRRCSHG